MKRETKIIRGSLAALVIGGLVALPAVTAQATEAPVDKAPATSHQPSVGTDQPAPGQPVTPETATPAASPETVHTASQEKVQAETPADQQPSAPATPTPASDPRPSAAPESPIAEATTVKVSADKAAIAAGKTLTGAIEGLGADQHVTASLVSTDNSADKPDDLLCTVAPGALRQTISCDIPKDQAPGTYRLTATYQDADEQSVTTSSDDIQVYLYDPRISGPNLPVSPGTSISIKGSGYQPGSTLQIATTFYLTGGQAAVDQDGNFTFELKVSPFAPEGEYPVTVTDPATGIQQQLTVYVRKGNATLQVEQDSGQAGFSTTVSGSGFSDNDTPYPVDLKIYDADGTSVLAVLASGVEISNGVLPGTLVQIPASATPGLYQISAVANAESSQTSDLRLAATWIAVFPPKETIVTPPVIVTPPPVVIITPPVTTPTTTQPTQILPPSPAPAPALPPLAHQLGAIGISNPFSAVAYRLNRIPDLNSSTPSPNPQSGGSISADPTPEGNSSATPQEETAAINQAQSSQEIWPMVLVGLIAIVLGLALGYFLALAGRRRSAT